VSISGSQPANGIAIRYRRLSARHYLGRCSRKWREHPRGSLLTYRRRKWPTHPPYGEKLVPPSLEVPSFPLRSRQPPPYFDVPSVYPVWREVKDSAPAEAPGSSFCGMARISRAERISFFLVSGKTRSPLWRSRVYLALCAVSGRRVSFENTTRGIPKNNRRYFQSWKRYEVNICKIRLSFPLFPFNSPPTVPFLARPLRTSRIHAYTWQERISFRNGSRALQKSFDSSDT